jgi:hypothetical protein
LNAPRQLIDLRTCKLQQGKRDNGQLFFAILDYDTGNIHLQLSFETQTEFSKWGKVLLESTKSDA